MVGLELCSPKLCGFHCGSFLVNQNHLNVSRPLGVYQCLVLLLGRQACHIAYRWTRKSARSRDRYTKEHTPADEPIKIFQIGKALQRRQHRFGKHSILID